MFSRVGRHTLACSKHLVRNLPGSAINTHALRATAALLWLHTICQEVTLQASQLSSSAKLKG